MVRYSTMDNSTLNRLSYLQPRSPDNGYSVDFDPCKNLNDVFREVEDENLKVYLRVRPTLAEEKAEDEESYVEILDNNTIKLTAPASSNNFKTSNQGITQLTQKFSFSRIYGPNTNQKDLFDATTQSLVKDFISGQNCLLFTYGATNSGKTFTVQGTQSDPGLLPRTLQQIFSSVGSNNYPRNDLKPKYFCNIVRLEKKERKIEDEKKEAILSQSVLSMSKMSSSDNTLNMTNSLFDGSEVSHNSTMESKGYSVLEGSSVNNTMCSEDGHGFVYAVFISFAEIYNEFIFDLLVKIPSSRKSKWSPLMLGEDRNGAIYVKGLQEIRVNSAQEALQLLSIGRHNLHFAATKLNHHSSRSHSIFTVKVVRLANAQSPHVATVSMLSVCDLAGSERAGKSLGGQDRIKEAGNINTSLLVLSRCIEALRRNQINKCSKKKEVPVPYRDSKLTRLFQSFFLGKGKIAMIVNIAKLPLLFDETIQVLKFSAIAKQVTLCHNKIPEPQPKEIKSTRISQFSRFMRQSLRSSGRLSAPWETQSVATSFGQDESKVQEDKNFMSPVQEEEARDEEIDGYLELIANLKDEVVKAHKEKLDLEVKLREELCKEFSQQIVEIENNWSQRLKDQQTRSEEMIEWKINVLMRSNKINEGRKRMREDEDHDDEYVSSIHLFREQKKVEELDKKLEEVEKNRRRLEEEVDVMKEGRKKARERENRVQEENSRLTFQLAQLTQNYDKLMEELKESRNIKHITTNSDSEAVGELKDRLEEKRVYIEEHDIKFKEVQSMLCEAAEMYMAKEETCSRLEKNLNMTEQRCTQQTLMLEEREKDLEEIRSLFSQKMAILDERDSYIEELRQQLDKLEKTDGQTNMERKLEEMEKEMEEREEEYLREKSKLLLQVAELKRTQGKQQQLQEEEAAVEAKERLTMINNLNIQLKDDYEMLNDRCSELDANYSELKKENVKLNEANSKLKDDIVKLNDQKNDDGSELDPHSELNANYLDLKNEYDKLSEANSKLTDLNSQLKDEIKKLNDQELETKYTELKQENMKINEAHSKLKDEIEKLNDQKSDNVYSELKQEYIKLNEDNCKLTEDHRKLNDRCQKLNDAKKVVEVKLQESESFLNHVKQMNSTLENEQAQLNLELADLKKLNNDLSEKVVNLQELRASEQLELEKERERYNEREKEVEIERKGELEIEKERTEWEREIEAEREKLVLLEREREEREREIERKWEEREKEVERDREEKEKEIERIREKGKEVEREKAVEIQRKMEIEREMRERELEERNQEKGMREEKERLETELERERETITELEKSIACLNKLVERLEGERDRVEKELKGKVDGLEKELEKLRSSREEEKREEDKTRETQEILKYQNFENQLLLKTKENEDSKHQMEMELENYNIEMEELQKKNSLLQEQVISTHNQDLVQEYKQTIAALHNKIESLDKKLNCAEDEKENIETILKEKCDRLEKEIGALREARSEQQKELEKLTSVNDRTIDTKDNEISRLEQEVKKLLQQSLISSSHDKSTNERENVHDENAHDLTDIDIQSLRDEMRHKVSINESLMQEVQNLKEKVEKLTNTESQKVADDVNMTHSRSRRRTKKKQNITSDTSQHDSSMDRIDEAKKTQQNKSSGIFHPAFAQSSKSGITDVTTPNTPRTSSRTKRSTKKVSYVYEEDLNDFHEPRKAKRKATRKSTRKTVETPSPYKEKENKSSLANKADEANSTIEEQTGNINKNCTKKKHYLYKVEFDEPYAASPNQVAAPEASSPHSFVRRQLRTRRK